MQLFSQIAPGTLSKADLKNQKNAELRRGKGFFAHAANQDDEQPLALGPQIAQGRSTKIHKKAPDLLGRAPNSLL